MINANGTVKSIVCAKKIVAGIQGHAFVGIVSIEKYCW